MLCVGLRWKTFAQKQSNQLLVSFSSLGFLQVSRNRQLEEGQTSASRLLDVEPRICGLVHERLHVHLGKAFFQQWFSIDVRQRRRLVVFSVNWLTIALK